MSAGLMRLARAGRISPRNPGWVLHRCAPQRLNGFDAALAPACETPGRDAITAVGAPADG